MHPTLDAAFQSASALPARGALRAAIVTETWPPEVNGLARTVARAVQGLQARGHALQLVRPCQHRVDDDRARGAGGIRIRSC